jgi:hypothetical protein
MRQDGNPRELASRPSLSIAESEVWEMWRSLNALHPGRATPIDAQEIEAALSIYGVRLSERRIEIFRALSAVEATYLEHDPADEDDGTDED